MTRLSPIDRLVLDAVRCVSCGARYGECACVELQTIRDEQEASRERLRAILPAADFAALEARWREIDARQRERTR